MGAEPEHHSKKSGPFFLLTPARSSNCPMRRSPGKTTPRCSRALHLIPQGCFRRCGERLLSYTSLPALSATTSHPTLTTSHPQSHRVQRPGGLIKHKRHFWTVQPDQQLVVADTSSPHHWSKGLICSWLYSILLTITSMAEVGQKQRHSGLQLTVGTTLQEKYEPRDAALTEWQEAWAALPAVFL